MAVNINKPLAILLALLLGFVLAGSVSAQPPDVSRNGEKGEMVTLDFQDVELSALVKTISELTGKNFLYDSSLKGKATIISPQEMTIDEAYDLFHHGPERQGLHGGAFRVKSTKSFRSASAKEENLPTVIHPPTQRRGFRTIHHPPDSA